MTSDNYHHTIDTVIRSFRHKGLLRLYEDGDTSRIRTDLLAKVENILAVLDAASSPREIEIPGCRLHPLKGQLRGLWSLTVRANWRIVFRFDDGDVLDVDLVDYH